MILRPVTDGTLLLITQPDHARLAASIIAAWRDASVPASFRATVLYAIEQHDNGWRELDETPTLNAETGRPHDFMSMPSAVKQDIWPRGVERRAADSPLAAALVAEHALTLHSHRREDPAWAGFFPMLEQLKARLLRECQADAGPARELFDRGYDLLHLGDVVSLVFCNRWPGPMTAGRYRMSMVGDEVVLVSPDPFDGVRVRFELKARAIADRWYASGAELRAAFDSADIVTLRGSVRAA